MFLITNYNDKNLRGGRQNLCYLNFLTLSRLYGNSFICHHVPIVKSSTFIDKIFSFFGYIDGINRKNLKFILKQIDQNCDNEVFIDGSNLGEIARYLKKYRPHIKIYTFFHNVEAIFFWYSFVTNKTLHSSVVTLVNFLAEKKSVDFSDKIICLNNRDKVLINKLYNRKSEIHICNLAIQDSFPKNYSLNNTIINENKPYALFVGGDFYANVAGMDWFIRNVANKVSLDFLFVGKGLDKYKLKYKQYTNVKIIGEVDNLFNFYYNSLFVIAPIFDGSGMKTKVAEALMYGKLIIGTTESFEGYEIINDTEIGILCNTIDEFISSINRLKITCRKGTNMNIRNFYLNNYSSEKFQSRLKEILFK